jgi:hypothetical protein
VPQGRVLTRGDRRRNERLARLWSIVRRDFAVVAVDLASVKQAAVVTDHDSVVLGRDERGEGRVRWCGASEASPRTAEVGGAVAGPVRPGACSML